MTTTNLKSQLHLLIDQTTDREILQAIHSLLSNKDTFDYSSELIDKMLIASEEDVKYGKTTAHDELKKEITTWRK